MAISVASTIDYRIVKIVFRDTAGSKTTKTFFLDQSVTDSGVQTFLGHLDALTNAGVIKAYIADPKSVTGWTAVSTAAQNLVSNFLALTFQRTDSVNANKIITKDFVIPAYLDALRAPGSPARPVATNSDLNALVSFLAANLVYIDSAGTPQSGAVTNWAFVQTESGFGSGARVTGE